MKNTALTSSWAKLAIWHDSCVVFWWHRWAIYSTCTCSKSALVNQGLKFGKGKKRELGSCYSREIQLNQPSSHYKRQRREYDRCQNCVLYFGMIQMKRDGMRTKHNHKLVWPVVCLGTFTHPVSCATTIISQNMLGILSISVIDPCTAVDIAYP